MQLGLQSGRGRMCTGHGWCQPETARELKQSRSLQQSEQEYGSYRQISDDTWNSNRCYMDENSICARPCSVCRSGVLRLHTGNPLSLYPG